MFHDFLKYFSGLTWPYSWGDKSPILRQTQNLLVVYPMESHRYIFITCTPLDSMGYTTHKWDVQLYGISQWYMLALEYTTNKYHIVHIRICIYNAIYIYSNKYTIMGFKTLEFHPYMYKFVRVNSIKALDGT